MYVYFINPHRETVADTLLHLKLKVQGLFPGGTMNQTRLYPLVEISPGIYFGQLSHTCCTSSISERLLHELPPARLQVQFHPAVTCRSLKAANCDHAPVCHSVSISFFVVIFLLAGEFWRLYSDCS